MLVVMPEPGCILGERRFRGLRCKGSPERIVGIVIEERVVLVPLVQRAYVGQVGG